MSEQQSFHANVLANMADGVMALDMQGAVTMFNPAAGRILGLQRDDVVGQAFGAVFMTMPVDNDEFTQLILDAVYKNASGMTERVTFNRPDGGAAELSVTCSYIRESDGEADPGGVVVVMSDVTELARLQKEERDLRTEIQDTCVRLEDANDTLQQALRRVRVMRWAALAVVAAIVLGAGGWAWQSGGMQSLTGGGPPSGGLSEEQQQLAFTPVRVEDISTSISLSGNLEPIERVNVVSPFGGRVLKKHFSFGQRVDKGALLFTLDTTELMNQLREARSAYIKARQQLYEVEHWEQSSEVSRARRSYQRSSAQMESLAAKLESTRALFEKGIVPRNELESVEESYRNQRMDLVTAKEELASVLAKGDEENRVIARMEFENAKTRYEELERRVDLAEVRAPVQGVVIRPPQDGSSGEKSVQSVETGVSVQEGTVLVAVANLEGLSVRTSVDEVDIGKLSLGQKVRVTGDAFPGVVLNGEVAEISSQAKTGMNSIPRFDVTVAISDVTEQQMRLVRLGMSATLEVTVYDNPKALLVPIDAVRYGSDGNYVLVRGQGGEVRRQPVKTGMTTMTEVEILSGLEPGQRVGMAPGSGGAAMPRAAEAGDAGMSSIPDGGM